MKRAFLFLFCLLLLLLAACASAPAELILEPLDETAGPEMSEAWEGTARIVTRFGPASEARIELPEPTAESSVGEAAPDQAYILNTNSRRFHEPSCPSVDEMKPSNREEFFGNRDTLLALGYTPCGRCRP